MITQEHVREAIKADAVGYDRDACAFIDPRDYARLTDFFPVEEWPLLGFEIVDKTQSLPVPDPKYPWTEEAIKARLKKDWDFALEKAQNQRGISAGLMQEVVRMWLWILEDPLVSFEPVDEWGMDFLNAVKEKYQLGAIP